MGATEHLGGSTNNSIFRINSIDFYCLLVTYIFCHKYNNIISKLLSNWQSSFLERESVSGRVENPGIVVGALHASVQAQCFSRKLSGVQGARIGQGAVGLALVVALLLPLGEVTETRQFSRVLHPLNDLVWQKKLQFHLDQNKKGFTFVVCSDSIRVTR
jgi:hypothetical protein